MRAFLDFEASSLAKHGYPIEVAWAFEDGRAESWLIRPAEGWTDWDARAEAIHGLARATLEAEGAPAGEVAARMVAALDGHALYASAPSWDGKWLSQLLRAGGVPRHALRLRDTEEVRRESVLAALAPVVPRDALEAAATQLLGEVEVGRRGTPHAHRALADAQEELAWWRAAISAAEVRAGEMGAGTDIALRD